jgi:tetratricopeptide (TPR) repeat protein
MDVPVEQLPSEHAAPLDELERIERAVLAKGDALDRLDWLAFMFYANRQPAKARGYYERLVGMVPDNASYHYYLGDVLKQLGQPEAARTHWNRVCALDAGAYGALAKGRLMKSEGGG